MKLYSFYTKPIEEMYTVLSESVKETDAVDANKVAKSTKYY